MVAMRFEIKRYSKNFHVIINMDEEKHKVQLEIASVEFLSAMLEQKVDDLVKLLALIEFIRLDSSAINKNKLKSFIDDNDFKDNLKVILEVKNCDEIIEEISEMKYYEMVEYFFGESEDE